MTDTTRRKPPAAGKGRPKGALNKTTTLLKDAILQAATEAGEGDLVAYLKVQAIENPAPFLALMGKVLPIQNEHSGPGGHPMHHIWETVVVDPGSPTSK